jgi:AraC-like DNA-binding protein
VHTIQTSAPCPQLRGFVRCYGQREMICSSSDSELPFIASLEYILEFNFYDREVMERPCSQSQVVSPFHILGPQTKSVRRARFQGHFRAFGIFLKPLAFWQLFRIPSHVVTDQDLSGTDLLGQHMEVLWSKLAESKSYEQRIFEADKHLLPFAMNALAHTGIMLSARYIARNKGAARIEKLADLSGLGVRQYERRFAEQMGMGPKAFSRIARFQTALDAKRIAPNLSWLTIAHESGYYDQAHMIRDFESLGGEVPRAVLKLSGDLQPWSLAGSKPISLR